MEKKITINEWREMKKNDPKVWVHPKVKDEDIPAVRFTWDEELNTFVYAELVGMKV